MKDQKSWNLNWSTTDSYGHLISKMSWCFEALTHIANDFEFLSGFHLNIAIKDLKK